MIFQSSAQICQHQGLWKAPLLLLTILVRVSIAVKRHHELLQRKTFNWAWLTVSEVQSIITMAGHGSVQASMVLEKELRVLHLDL